MRFRWLAGAALASTLALTAAACGDDDASDPTPTASAGTPSTPGTTSTPGTPGTTPAGGSPSPSATPTSPEAERLAQSPQYFLYEVSQGDTLFSVANAFDAVNGNAGVSAFVERIKQDNKLTSDALTPGQVIAIPLMLPGTLAMIPENSIEEALGLPGGQIKLLQPSLAMREGYLGRLALHRVRLLPATAAGGPAYVMEYWLTDRPPIKGGEVDPDARVANPAFAVYAGGFAQMISSDIHRFTDGGVQYAVRAFPNAGRSEQELAGMLQTASQR